MDTSDYIALASAVTALSALGISDCAFSARYISVARVHS